MRRVLTADGQLLFVEHGLAAEEMDSCLETKKPNAAELAQQRNQREHRVYVNLLNS